MDKRSTIASINALLTNREEPCAMEVAGVNDVVLQEVELAHTHWSGKQSTTKSKKTWRICNVSKMEDAFCNFTRFFDAIAETDKSGDANYMPEGNLVAVLLPENWRQQA